MKVIKREVIKVTEYKCDHCSYTTTNAAVTLEHEITHTCHHDIKEYSIYNDYLDIEINCRERCTACNFSREVIVPNGDEVLAKIIFDYISKNK